MNEYEIISITVRNKHLLRVSIALLLSPIIHFMCVHILSEKCWTQLPLYTKEDLRMIAPLKSVLMYLKVNKIKKWQLLMIIIIINNHNKE